MQAWFDKIYRIYVTKGYYSLMLEGLGNTIKITLGALCIGVILGSLIALVKYMGEDTKGLKWLVKILDGYVTAIRGIPVVVLLLIFYYVVFLYSDNGILVAIITFGINSSAYMAEVIRSGINAVDKGQMEAGRSLGLSKVQCTWKIILPQAIRNILPAIGNELIALLKETSVAGYCAIVDVTRAGNLVRNNTYEAAIPLVIVALIYLILVIILTKLLGIFERRLAKSDKR